MLPDGPNGELIEVPIADLGIKYPVVVTPSGLSQSTYMAEPIDGTAPGTMPMAIPEGNVLPGATGVAGQQGPKMFKLRQYDFIVQFCWQPEPRGKRLEKMAQKKNARPARQHLARRRPARPPLAPSRPLPAPARRSS